jgi:hypothetical protein
LGTFVQVYAEPFERLYGVWRPYLHLENSRTDGQPFRCWNVAVYLILLEQES